jgi:hypothetical protein
MAKKFDPKAKAKKQKIVAAVLGVLFLGVMVYQAPTILGLFGGGSSEVATEPAPPPSPAAAPAAPAAGTPIPAAATPAPGGSAELVDSDPAPAETQSQLITFDRFTSKDPFAQQAEKGAEGRTSQPSPVAGEPPAGVAGPKPQPEPPSARPTASAGTAKISVNGVATEVTVDGTFPASDQIFKLVSLTKSTAKVGIVDGTYATGSPTITLKRGGKPVTLMNTADGTTYVLRLVSVG